MNINQITITTIAVILTAFTPGVAAEPGNKENADKAAHEQRKDKPEEHQVVDSQRQSWGSDDHRDNDDRDRSEHGDNNDWGVNDRRDNSGWRSTDSRGNENSNRQSDSGSTRGQERAAERRSENADQHDRSNREPRWYDFIFGEGWGKADKDSIDDLAEKKTHWWWPFN